jgi:hypothetical protein
MRRSPIVLLLFLATSLSAQKLDLRGYLTGRGINAGGPPSWIEGGFGRLGAGDGDRAFGIAQAGVDWRPVRWLGLHASGVARAEPNDYHGTAVGIIEAYAELNGSFGSEEVRFRAGQFFLPTSRENKGDLWTSPYTISFSAVNTWIGEEVRPIGADLEWRHTTGGGYIWSAGATGFRGNDTMGTLLGWRGWSVGNRLSVYNEVLPLPPLPTFATLFPAQRRSGTKPFGSDLDGKTGFAGRVRFAAPERGMIQYTRVDNQADRRLHTNEYAWATEFNLLSAEIGNTDRLIVAAEYIDGTTGMGFRGSPWVQADFNAGYVLISGKRNRNRLSARYDMFRTEDADGHPRAERNDEDGRSWTFAWFFDVTPKLRAGAEFTQITGDRIANQVQGFDPNTDARSVTVELRYSFGKTF